jgi:hypothetical protein
VDERRHSHGDAGSPKLCIDFHALTCGVRLVELNAVVRIHVHRGLQLRDGDGDVERVGGIATGISPGPGSLGELLNVFRHEFVEGLHTRVGSGCADRVGLAATPSTCAAKIFGTFLATDAGREQGRAEQRAS